MPGLTTVPRHTSALASHVMLNGNGAAPASWAEPNARPFFIHAEMVVLPATSPGISTSSSSSSTSRMDQVVNVLKLPPSVSRFSISPDAVTVHFQLDASHFAVTIWHQTSATAWSHEK